MSFPIWEGSYPKKPSGIINPTVSLNKVRVGLKCCVLLTLQATWRNVERRIKGPIDRRVSIAWSTDHRIAIKTRAEIQSVITVVMRSGGAHPDRPIKIEGAKSKAFYNVSLTITSGPSIAIGRLGYF